MFCIIGLRRFRIFTQAHILERLWDVNNLFLKNCHSPSFERVLRISSSSRRGFSVQDPLKAPANDEESQGDFPRKQIHPSHHDVDATSGEILEDKWHRCISGDKHEWPRASHDASTEDHSNAACKAEEFDNAPYVLDHMKRKRSKAVTNSPKYPLINMGNESKKVTPNFEKCEKLLQSLNIPTFELPHYPDIQEMSNEELLLYTNRLKEIGIHFVFSLFLIQRMAAEVELEHTAKRAPLAHSKYSFKLRNGKYKLSSMQAVTHYLMLCRLLENPELDLHEFMNNLAAANVYDHLRTLVSKVQQLRSVGARPLDILSNLKLLDGSKIFKAKIQLYNHLFSHSKPPFPVNLFLSSTITKFREKLQVGKDISVIANLLGVTPEEFLMCWGFKSVCTRSLIHKVHLLLKAGISKQDLFNNISMINRLSLNKSQPKLESLLKLKSGDSITLYELKAMEDGMNPNDPDVNPVERDWTMEDQSDSGATSPVDVKKMLKDNPSSKRNRPEARRRSHHSVETSKIWRMEVFNHITHHLQLDTKARRAMYKANVSVDSTHIQDIAQNLDYLTSTLKFTKEQISACPLILAHPHKDLHRVTQEVESLLEQHLTWSAIGRRPLTPSNGLNGVDLPSSSSSSELLQGLSSSVSSSSSSPSPSSSSLSASITSEENLSSLHVQSSKSLPFNYSFCNDQSGLPHLMDYSSLITDPITHLNILQYFLEKDNGFSLLSTESVVFRN